MSSAEIVRIFEKRTSFSDLFDFANPLFLEKPLLNKAFSLQDKPGRDTDELLLAHHI